MTETLKCVIVDDEPLARELIKSYVARTQSLSLEGCFESAADAVKCIIDNCIDIIFLDIDMPVLNGIEFASIIPKHSRIIYVTAYEKYALQGFKVNALDYLLKPVSYAEFMGAVGKALEWFAMSRQAERPACRDISGMLTVKADYKLVQMRLDSIRYVEVQKDRLIFNRADGSSVTSLMSMKEIEDLLPADVFMRVHRSFIVNLREVEIVERGRIVFGKTYIPVSDSKKEEFLSRLGR